MNDISLATITPNQVERARVTVAALAVDAADARELLDALGIAEDAEAAERRRLRRLEIAAMSRAGRELLAVQGLLPAPLVSTVTPKPNSVADAARSIAARLDACWPTGGPR